MRRDFILRQIKATNTSIRDFPQVAAVVSKGKIMVKSYLGKELAGQFSFDRSLWPDQPDDQIPFLKERNRIFEADPSLYGQEQGILDAQVGAINEAILKFEGKD